MFIDQPDGSSLFLNDATWIVRDGLADDANSGVSFESVNYPGQYLRYQNLRIRIDPLDGSQLFREDATWYQYI